MFKKLITNTINKIEDLLIRYREIKEKYLTNSKKDGDLNSRHKHYKKIQIPDKRYRFTVKNLYKKEYESGVFENDIYYDISDEEKFKVCFKIIIDICKPAIIWAFFVLGLNLISNLIIQERVPIRFMDIFMILLGFSLFLPKAIKRVNDYLSYFHNTITMNMYQINQLTFRWINEGKNITQSREFKIMNQQRIRYNKYLLFPSIRELAVTEQLFIRDNNSKNPTLRHLSSIRKKRLTLENRELEHIASSKISQINEQKTGRNEYNDLVDKYKYRTIPRLQGIVNNLYTKKDRIELK